MSRKMAFRAGEVSAINGAWSNLEAWADRQAGSPASYLAQALRYETTGQDRLPVTDARGLVLKWFLDGCERADMKASELYGLRPGAVLALTTGAKYAADISSIMRLGLERAKTAHDNAFKRHCAVLQADVQDAVRGLACSSDH